MEEMKRLHPNIRKEMAKIEVNTLLKENLNFKQRIAYDVIEDWVNEKIEGREVTPLYLNISGRAGCGKSAVLNCISRYIHEKAKPSFLKIGAPTGTAAFLVKGNTLHNLLRLPINNSKSQINELKGENLRDLQEKFKNVELLVIDEKSMIGQYFFYMIDARCKEAKPENAKLPFGGISIILMGDFAQLPPVRDSPLFMELEESKKSKSANNQQIAQGYLLFRELFRENTIIFDEIMRQGEDQKEFKEVLDRIASGNFTREDWAYLRERDLNGPNFTPEQRKEIRSKSIKVCALNQDTVKYNVERIYALGTPVAGVKSQNKGKGSGSATANEAQGLHSNLIIARECQVLLTSNLWQEAGLTNGARGTVKYIIYEKGQKPPRLPAMVIVQFDQYIGPSYLENEEKCVPIVIQERNFTKQQVYCTRKMLPMKPGYAISIHSSQGATLHSVIVNLGPREFATGLAYVASTRVRKIENIYFDPMPDFRRIAGVKGGKIFKQRVDQDKREVESDKKFVEKWLNSNKEKENM